MRRRSWMVSSRTARASRRISEAFMGPNYTVLRGAARRQRQSPDHDARSTGPAGHGAGARADDGTDLRPNPGASRHDRRDGHLRPAPAARGRPRAARHGAVPAHVNDASMCRVRAASVLLPEGDSWISATEKARQSDAGVPIAWVPFAP